MSEVLLSVREIVKRFGDFTAVDGVSLDVHSGETVGLLGVNGAGKTTLMNMILGLITPSGGSIHAFGMDLAKHRIEILKRTNFCTTYATLPGNLKVHHNLEIFARLYQVKQPTRKVAELLELLEIPHLANKITGQLSAGESTRVNLAKALLNDPDLLLLDEPTASLDPDIADKVRKLVRRIQREQHPAILYTSHTMRGCITRGDPGLMRRSTCVWRFLWALESGFSRLYLSWSVLSRKLSISSPSNGFHQGA